MSILFWSSVAVILFVYFGYPLLLLFFGSVSRRSVTKDAFEPSLTILISAFNEEKHIGATIENKLELDYPADRREIIVISDGSTDKTEEIVKTYDSRGVRLLVQSPRAGKTAALNRAVEEAKGEILVFSDANSIYASNALHILMRNFSDARVGYVTGKMVYVDETGSIIGKGCSAYMQYENWLRALETKLGSVIGVDGGIDAARKKLYRPMSPDMLPDFVLPLNVIDQGYRVVYEEAALLKESSLNQNKDEWRMRIRVILRSFHALWFKKNLFNPIRFGFVSFQLLFHKLFRYWVGFFQLIAFGANTALLTVSPVYVGLFAAQGLFYFGALLGWGLGQKLPFAKYAFYLCLLNAASLLAFFKFLKGEKQVIWAPRKG